MFSNKTIPLRGKERANTKDGGTGKTKFTWMNSQMKELSESRAQNPLGVSWAHSCAAQQTKMWSTGPARVGYHRHLIGKRNHDWCATSGGPISYFVSPWRDDRISWRSAMDRTSSTWACVTKLSKQSMGKWSGYKPFDRRSRDRTPRRVHQNHTYMIIMSDHINW